MVLVSHRGNIDGKNIELENNPSYIDTAIEKGYDVEIDLWVDNDGLYLGHDEPTFPIKIEWLQKRNHKLWIHCKNHKALETLYGSEFHYFWHHDDDVTLTSRGIIWAHPKIQPLKNSIAVLPDNYNWNLDDCMGICSDYIKKYENIS